MRKNFFLLAKGWAVGFPFCIFWIGIEYLYWFVFGHPALAFVLAFPPQWLFFVPYMAALEALLAVVYFIALHATKGWWMK